MFHPEMSILASLLNLGGPDLIWILLLILLLFGAKKLPELARGMGQAIVGIPHRPDPRTRAAVPCGREATPPRLTSASLPR